LLETLRPPIEGLRVRVLEADTRSPKLGDLTKDELAKPKLSRDSLLNELLRKFPDPLILRKFSILGELLIIFKVRSLPPRDDEDMLADIPPLSNRRDKRMRRRTTHWRKEEMAQMTSANKEKRPGKTGGRRHQPHSHSTERKRQK
jgi:hypothetical protein